MLDVICRVISSRRPSPCGCGAVRATEPAGLCCRLQQYIAEDVAVCWIQHSSSSRQWYRRFYTDDRHWWSQDRITKQLIAFRIICLGSTSPTTGTHRQWVGKAVAVAWPMPWPWQWPRRVVDNNETRRVGLTRGNHTVQFRVLSNQRTKVKCGQTVPVGRPSKRRQIRAGGHNADKPVVSPGRNHNCFFVLCLSRRCRLVYRPKAKFPSRPSTPIYLHLNSSRPAGLLDRPVLSVRVHSLTRPRRAAVIDGGLTTDHIERRTG